MDPYAEYYQPRIRTSPPPPSESPTQYDYLELKRKEWRVQQKRKYSEIRFVMMQSIAK